MYPQNIWQGTRYRTSVMVFIVKEYMRENNPHPKTEFVRLRVDKIEKSRLEKLCSITRRQKSDLIRESLFELYKRKYPECLID